MTIMLAKNIAMAWQTIRSSRGRSLLTMLGVVIAVAAVTSVISIGRGIQQAVVHQANQYSKNVITVRPARVGSGLAGLDTTVLTALTSHDADAINKLPQVSHVVSLQTVASSAQADASFHGPVFAANDELSNVLNQQLAYGAFYTSTESTNSIAVLGSDAASKLFSQRIPLGRSFTINGQQFIVGGVLDPYNTTPLAGGTNFNDAIFVPDASASQLAPNGAPIYEILAKIDNADHVQSADRAIQRVVAKAHHSGQAVQVLTPAELANQNADLFKLLASLVLAAAVITLLVSGVGIMNVMLVSVTERMHEIGIRKAVGATNRQILNQFVTEAAVLCVLGSVTGAVVSFVGLWLLGVFGGLTAAYDWLAAGLSCLAACVFGILFGMVPAVKAARKDPIAALRSGE